MTPEEFQSDAPGRGHVRTLIEKSIGRTIKSIWFGPDSPEDTEETGERLVFTFTDGSSLDLEAWSFIPIFRATDV